MAKNNNQKAKRTIDDIEPTRGRNSVSKELKKWALEKQACLERTKHTEDVVEYFPMARMTEKGLLQEGYCELCLAHASRYVTQAKALEDNLLIYQGTGERGDPRTILRPRKMR